MNDEINRRYFMAKDIKAVLGITPGQLFHWGKTWKLVSPEIRAEGRQGKDKYSFKGLLTLSLIKELSDLGLDLGMIRRFLESHDKGKDIFEEIKERSALDRKKYKYFLLISEISESSWRLPTEVSKEMRDVMGSENITPITNEKILEKLGIVKGRFKPILLSILTLKTGELRYVKDLLLASKKMVVVNLSAIISELESKTGEKL
jgi:DNA-binding transcriptional MerR regulator